MRRVLQQVPFMVPTVRWLRSHIDPVERDFRRIRRQPEEVLFQSSAFTLPDRYPTFFTFVRDHLGQTPSPKVLSYGCATGEEVFALHRLMPNATIKGIDINAHCIRVCQRRLARAPIPRIRFECAASPGLEPDDQWDAVFCMAVTRHGSLDTQRPSHCDPILRFEDFERLMSELARCLRPGGYLAIWHSNFRFCDTTAAEQFEVAMQYQSRHPERRCYYGRENQRLDHTTYREAIFRKKPPQALESTCSN